MVPFSGTLELITVIISKDENQKKEKKFMSVREHSAYQVVKVIAYGRLSMKSADYYKTIPGTYHFESNESIEASLVTLPASAVDVALIFAKPSTISWSSAPLDGP